MHSGEALYLIYFFIAYLRHICYATEDEAQPRS
jgi:hypothetical protein